MSAFLKLQHLEPKISSLQTQHTNVLQKCQKEIVTFLTTLDLKMLTSPQKWKGRIPQLYPLPYPHQAVEQSLAELQAKKKRGHRSPVLQKESRNFCTEHAAKLVLKSL